jgi:predicted transport protein
MDGCGIVIYQKPMPLFQISKDKLTAITQSNFLEERVLQKLIEGNLNAVFRCRLVASEFSTGREHAGRIDTLGLSEDCNPVIIEYKKVQSSELINQSLYYLHWIQDHKGDFERAVQKTLGASVEVDWSDIRVICIAPSFKKYDLHAVQVMGANIELWTYRLFANGCIYFEEILQRSYVEEHPGAKNPVMVAAGKKAAITRSTGSYSFEGHLAGKSSAVQELALTLQDFIQKLDPAIEEVPKKLYVAYRTSQNIACAEIQKQKILLFLKVDPKITPGPASISRDVSKIGHFGTGDLEITLRTLADLEQAKPFIIQAYQEVGA